MDASRLTREKAVSIRWKIDADNFRALVADHIEETGILMSESVVILAPDHGGEQDVEGSDLRTPLNLQALLNPFAVL